MSLREHLRELRQRLLKAALAVALGAVAGWFLYDPLINALQQPLVHIRDSTDRLALLNFSQVASSFNLKLKLSIYIGVVVASPVWLYQLWAFIVPGLTGKEKRYAVGFVGTAVPLFLAGIYMAWRVLPNAVLFLTAFTPAGSGNVIDADEYLTFCVRVLLAFGIAFVLPLLLVALNLAGLVSARQLAKGWRVAVFLTFLFAAVASPTPDAGSMLALAFPMVALYMAAVGVAWFVDRRRAKRRAADPVFGLDDDEAAPLDVDDQPLTSPSGLEDNGR